LPDPPPLRPKPDGAATGLDPDWLRIWRRAWLADVARSHHRESVDMLVNDGHLYSTVDDDHFKGI